MKVNSLTDMLDLLALIVQIVASIIIFFNSPDNKPDGTWISERNEDPKIAKKKNKVVKYSFLVLCLGFVIQLISMILKLKFL